MKTTLLILSLATLSVWGYTEATRAGSRAKNTATSSGMTDSKEKYIPYRDYIKPLGFGRNLPYIAPYINYLGAKNAGC